MSRKSFFNRAGQKRRFPRNPWRGFETLEQRSLLAADPLISEFLSSNEGSLQDADGESSDWIEIYNRGDEVADLEGWYLTDDEGDLTKWSFPPTLLDPEAYLVVFASGKAQPDTDGNLHTSFRLSVGGEYLALVQPDGRTIASEFSPEYPPQFTDISFGLPMDEVSLPLVTGDSPAQYLVPLDDQLGTRWTEVSFVPGAEWVSETDQGQSVKAGVGFEVDSGFAVHFETDLRTSMHGINPSVYVRIPFTVDRISELRDLVLRMKFDDGYLAYLNGTLLTIENAPFRFAHDTAANVERPNEDAVIFDEFDLSSFTDILRSGPNVLAIQGANLSADDDDFLMVPELSTTVLTATDAAPGYFSSPTPGARNAAEFSLAPVVESVQHAPTQPSESDALLVTANVRTTVAEIAAVTLTYRVMFGEERELVMTDSGTGVDQTAGDGVYSAEIPAGVAAPGQMVRYFVAASDVEGELFRSPRILDDTGTDQSPEYYGTVVANPAVSSELPVLEWFTSSLSRARSRIGARASVYHEGEFYDNIFVRQRGGASNPNSQKFNFGDDHPFYVNEQVGRVSEFNMNASGSDPSYLRQTLAYNTYADAGNEASASFLTSMYVNGNRDRVGIFIEQVDASFLARQELDPQARCTSSYSARIWNPSSVIRSRELRRRRALMNSGTISRRLLMV